MSRLQLTIETVPAAGFVQELATGRRVELSFEIHNGSAYEVELVAIEQDGRSADGSLLWRRLVEARAPIAPGERLTLPDPLPSLAGETPLVALAYRFTFCTPGGAVEHVAVAPVSIERSGRPQLEPVRLPDGAEEDATPPTPRQLERAWFETLYELGLYRQP